MADLFWRKASLWRDPLLHGFINGAAPTAAMFATSYATGHEATRAIALYLVAPWSAAGGLFAALAWIVAGRLGRLSLSRFLTTALATLLLTTLFASGLIVLTGETLVRRAYAQDAILAACLGALLSCLVMREQWSASANAGAGKQ